MTFEELGLKAALLKAIAREGYQQPTPIQEQAIGHVLAGRDVLGIAQTGTGKTAAFALPILERLGDRGAQHKVRGRKARVLVLAPTRELATQIGESFSTYGRHTGLRQAVIFGGVSQNPQAKAVREGVDILVATPGRLMDLMQQGIVKLDGIEVLVIDEADRMFDMGFVRDIRKIVSVLPKRRQTVLFSATMPDDVRELADRVLTDPVRVQIKVRSAAADTVEQSVYFVAKKNKPALLEHVIEHRGMTRTLVFVRTKHGADRLARHLSKAGIRAEAIHGNKTQNARQKALQNFKSNRPPVLVATDVAARGLDIDEVSHVVNYDLPNVPETYVHRIGRTGRAGASGVAVSFCDHDEREHLREIEKLLRKKTPVCEDHPHYPPAAAGKAAAKQPAKAARPPVPERKPHTAGPADGRQRSRRRKYGKASGAQAAHPPAEPSRTEKRKAVGTSAAKASAEPSHAGKRKAAPRAANYTTMW